MSSSEKGDMTPDKLENVDDGNYVKKLHVDGTVDLIDAKAVGGDVDDMPKGYFLSPQFIGTVVAVCCGSIVAYLGWVLPANTLALINADIGPSPNLNWVATIWTLGSAVGFLLVGRLSDIFGRKWMVMGCGVLSLIGCIIGATATKIENLIAANAFNGVSAAGQLSHGIILGELVPNKLRGPIVTLVFASSLPFAVFGPIIARKFIVNTAAEWRWSYYLGIIFAGISLILYQFLYHPPSYNQLHVQGKSRWQQFKELDFVGIFMFIAGTVLFLVGLSWGGQAYPWKSAEVISTIILGPVVLLAFAAYEGFVCKTTPIMPPRLFRNVGFVSITLCGTVGAMVYYSMTVLWPMVIGNVYTTDVELIGWQSSVVGGGILLGQIIGGFAISYVPGIKIQLIVASCMGCAFIGALASITVSTHTLAIVLGVLGCTAIGFVEGVSFPGVTLVFEAQDIGLAAGVMGSIRAIGGAIAQSLYVTILTNRLTELMPVKVIPAATAAGLPQSSLTALFSGISAGSFANVPGITPEIIAAVMAAVKQAYLGAFHLVFYVTIPFSVLLIISSSFVPNMDSLLTKNVAKRLQKTGKNEGEKGDA